ncbi:MAG: hypothetical protein KDD60_10670, partial [Bdellovibrionales bacterium]|nr:hypothetical protein [Bdellovibrionales bacterium]
MSSSRRISFSKLVVLFFLLLLLPRELRAECSSLNCRNDIGDFPVAGTLSNPGNFALDVARSLVPNSLRVSAVPLSNSAILGDDNPARWSLWDQEFADLQPATLMHMFPLHAYLDQSAPQHFMESNP